MYLWHGFQLPTPSRSASHVQERYVRAGFCVGDQRLTMTLALGATCLSAGHRERYAGTEFELTDLVDKAAVSRRGTM